MWGPQLSMEQGALKSQTGSRGKWLSFPPAPFGSFPSLVLGTADSGLLSATVTSWNGTQGLGLFWKRDHESLLTLLAPDDFPWARPRE